MVRGHAAPPHAGRLRGRDKNRRRPGLAAKIRLIEQLVAGIVRRKRLQPKGARDVAKLLADNDVAAAPGWPVPQALSRSTASAPRTSPTGMRRCRLAVRSRPLVAATASFVRRNHQVGSGAPKLPRILDEDDAIGRLGHLGEERIHQRRLARRCAAATSTFWRLATAPRRTSAVSALMTPEAA